MEQDEFEAGVGMSRKWDAREAGREVAENTLKNLNKDPKFFLLFSTIHYVNNGGFQEFLDGVWEVLPNGTPLIGGVVPGFTIPSGCYMRGAVGFATYYPKMDVAIGVGHNTKRNPVKASKQCISSIKSQLSDSSYNSKFIYSLISSSLVMEIPFVGRRKILDDGFLSKTVTSSLNYSHYLQKGLGRESEILHQLIDAFPDYSILGGSSMDNMDFVQNYQFFGDNFSKNSVVVLALNTDLDIFTSFEHGMNKTDISLDITKLDKTKHVIKEINNKPATSEFLHVLGWPTDFLDEKIVYSTVPYYPLGFDNGDFIRPAVTPYFFGNSIITSYPVDNDKAYILTGSGRDIINSINTLLNKKGIVSPKFGLFSECATRVFTLGSYVYKEQEYLKSYFGDSPFLVLYMGGESSYTSDKLSIYGNELFCGSLFS